MKFVISALVFLAVVIVGFIAVLTLRPKKSETNQAVNKPVVLTEYQNTDATVTLTTEGRIVAEEDHRVIRITVSRNSRLIEIIKGYQGGVERSQLLPNTEAAFSDFLSALQVAGFTSVDRASRSKSEAGVCPTGQRFIYELRSNQEELIRTWSTSCSGGQGNFKGRDSLVRQLFNLQIPDYEQYTRSLTL